MAGTDATRVPTDLTGVLVRFAQRVREAGVDASPERVQALLAGLDVVGAGDPRDVYWVGRLTLCADPLDLVRFDRVFAEVFGTPTGRRPAPRPVLQVVPATLDADADPASGDDEGDDEATAMVANASRVERLRHRDVVDLTDDERADLHRLLAAFRMPGETRRTRRHRPAHRGLLDRPTDRPGAAGRRGRTGPAGPPARPRPPPRRGAARRRVGVHGRLRRRAPALRPRGRPGPSRPHRGVHARAPG